MSATTPRITKTPGVQGGEACLAGTRIPVWILVNYLRLGGSEQGLFEDYPDVGPPDLEAALAYARAHPDEIDDAIRRNEEGDEGLVE